MREGTIKTAAQFGILDRMQEFEKDLLKIEGISEVDFDIDGFWDNIYQVILIPKYSIPVSVSDYYNRRRKQLNEILEVCKKHDLKSSGDTIEDYGEHWYIVRKCGQTWKQ